MSTTTNTRGVGEAMVERTLLASYLDDGGWHTEANNVREGVDLESYENELSLIGWLLRNAALSAPDPAAQGEGWADESRKYLAYRLTQMADGGPLAFCADTLRDAASWLTAPPAQPAERVPVSIEAAIAHIQKKADDYAEENCDVEWDTGATVYRYGQAGEDYHHGLLELVDELTQLAASPAPSEGGKGVEVPSDWVPENLDRCCTELTNLINLQDDYDFDEMTVATFQTAIECIRVCETAAQQAAR